ncbi:hypothetical protein [Streptomyces sp. NPDC051162]|uniref:hypothetical protein n=1 Tax=unclassified Streptomyces TaxID=2593676 RepID=UPI0034215558
MPTHSIMPGHHPGHEGPGPVPRGTHLRGADHASRLSWAVPLTGAVVLGLYAVFLSGRNGFTTLGSWLMGIAVALVSGGVGYVLIRERKKMITEVRAVAYGSLFGCSMGFLYSLSGDSVLRSIEIGLLLGLGMGLVSYYVFYSHEH